MQTLPKYNHSSFLYSSNECRVFPMKLKQPHYSNSLQCSFSSSFCQNVLEFSTGINYRRLNEYNKIRKNQMHIIQNSEAAAADDDAEVIKNLKFGNHTNRRNALSISSSFLLMPFLSPFTAKSIETNIQSEKELKIRNVIREVITTAQAPSLLRLPFHDAGTYSVANDTGGMNGSILYELERPENYGLKRSIKFLQKAKAKLHPSIQVSWSDLIAVGGSVAVQICNGPNFYVGLGRKDKDTPDEENRLPLETMNVSELKQNFSEKGFTIQEMIVLCGSHTLGGKGFGDPVTFDNTYYYTLLKKPWLLGGQMNSMVGLKTDHALMDDEECVNWINYYAEDEERLFKDFPPAYIKMVNNGATWEI